MTLDDYNRAVESKDVSALSIPRTGKAKPLRAPFYGLRVVPGITMGGILVNGRAEVLNEKDKPIHGLYAAGRRDRRTDGQLPRRLHRRVDASGRHGAFGRGKRLAVCIGRLESIKKSLRRSPATV
jgi:hypothetical protein